MRTHIPDAMLATPRGRRADEILRACVHCGFCNATCPTYQVRGDELDGPRGRIYLIKGLLESGDGLEVARTHLDRCLTCRACETTCPSGVRYGELAEIGREILEERAPSRSLLLRALLAIVPRRRLLQPLVAFGRLFRALLPRRLRRLVAKPAAVDKAAVSARSGAGGRESSGERRSTALLLQGCVQRVVTPEVNAHLGDLLASRGFEPIQADDEECCGGLALHAGRTASAQALMAANVQRLAAANADVIVSSASGCGVTLKDYGRLLDDDAARSFGAKVRDASEVLAGFEFAKRTCLGREFGTVAWHCPCTLQHGQGLAGRVEAILGGAGYGLTQVPDAHLCCGSAGAYSLLQPDLALQLKERKAAALMRGAPDVVATANIGCQTHLADAVDVPVVHWLELIE